MSDTQLSLPPAPKSTPDVSPTVKPKSRRAPKNPAFKPPKLRKEELIPSDDDEESPTKDKFPPHIEYYFEEKEGRFTVVHQRGGR